MAIPATAIMEVQSGGGDTSNGGIFDPANANMLTDLTATSATGSSPVCASASYNFVAGDVGHWLFIKSGTNWTPGWYLIASVASNQATLSAAAGAGVLYGPPIKVTTAAGCAITGSPTGGTFCIDYSQGTAISLGTCTTSGANAVLLTAAATVAMVGNGVYIASGTNFTVGYYVVSSASAGVSLTLDRTCASGVGASGVANCGGPFATPGKAAGQMVGGNTMFIKGATYSIASATTNIATGCLSLPTGATGSATRVIGYNSVRRDGGTKPILQVTTTTITTGMVIVADLNYLENLDLDGNDASNCRGVSTSGTFHSKIFNCKIHDWTLNATNINSNATVFEYCDFYGNTVTSPACSGGSYYRCDFHDNSVSGVQVTNSGNYINRCRAWDNSGASSDGFSVTSSGTITNCIAYNNGRHGFTTTHASRPFTCANCIAVSNAGYGFTSTTTASNQIYLENCATYNNTSGAYNTSLITEVTGHITLSGDPFTNAAGDNFGLNNTAGAGASCRAAGLPGSFPAGGQTAYTDVGVGQHQDPSGGGTARLINGGLVQ